MAADFRGVVRRARRLAGGLEAQFVDPAAAGTAPHTKVVLRQQFLQFRSAVAEGRPLPRLSETGFRVFSQNDEDGIILFLLGTLGIGTGRFVDVGGGDGLTASNCANLALNFGFQGLFLEGDPTLSAACQRLYSTHTDTRQFPPVSVNAFVTRENVDGLIRDAGIEGDIDLLSVDVDGNDYWIWDAISVISPQIVVIETHAEYGRQDVLAPYRADYDWHKATGADEPIGASLAAGVRMAHGLGYRLVGGNRYGYNAFYLRNGVAEDLVPTVPIDNLL